MDVMLLLYTLTIAIAMSEYNDFISSFLLPSLRLVLVNTTGQTVGIISVVSSSGILDFIK